MTVQTFISYRIPICLSVLWSLPHLTVNPLGVAAVTQGVDGGPGLSGLVVQTRTSLGLLFPSMFDAMSCSRRENGRKKWTKQYRRSYSTGRKNKTKTSSWKTGASIFLNFHLFYQLQKHVQTSTRKQRGRHGQSDQGVSCSLRWLYSNTQA